MQQKDAETFRRGSRRHGGYVLIKWRERNKEGGEE